MKTYLGDSVYAETTPDGLVLLTTDNGHGPDNRIFLDGNVLVRLIGFAKKAGLICLEENHNPTHPTENE